MSTTSITLAQLLMTIDNYKTKTNELESFLEDNVRQQIMLEDEAIDVEITENEFKEKLKLYQNLISTLPQLQGILNQQNNSNLSNAIALANVKSIDSELCLYKTLSFITTKKTTEIVQKQIPNVSKTGYDIKKSINKFTCYLQRRETLQTYNQLEKKKKQLQLDIHGFNHTHTFDIDSNLINLY